MVAYQRRLQISPGSHTAVSNTIVWHISLIRIHKPTVRVMKSCTTYVRMYVQTRQPHQVLIYNVSPTRVLRTVYAHTLLDNLILLVHMHIHTYTSRCCIATMYTRSNRSRTELSAASLQTRRAAEVQLNGNVVA